MIKILIFGAGGVGCVYAYLLHNAGASVVAVCRTNYAVVKEKGIIIRSKAFGRAHFHPIAVQTATEAAEHGPYDYIIMCSKAFPGTAEIVKDAVSPQTAIVVAQNGINVEEEYAKLYPQNTIIPAAVYLPVTQVEPGIVEHAALERLEIGTYPADAPANAKAQVQQLADLFTAGGGSCPVFDDIQPKRWTKVAINASWNPMCALTVCDDANYLRSSSHAELMIRKIMREVGLVASAAGYPHAITEATIDWDIERPKSRLVTGGKEPSMLTDVREGRPMEVEAIIGNTMRVGQKHGVSTPYLELLYSLTKARNYSLAPDDEWKPTARQD